MKPLGEMTKDEVDALTDEDAKAILGQHLQQYRDSNTKMIDFLVKKITSEPGHDPDQYVMANLGAHLISRMPYDAICGLLAVCQYELAVLIERQESIPPVAFGEN